MEQLKVQIHPLMEKRRSPRAFDPRPLERDVLARLFEAARWAASSSNSQPWRYLVTLHGTPAFEKLLGMLTEGNRRWAHRASALILAMAETDKRYAWHDLGLSTAQLCLQAVAEGLATHIMAGFSKEDARSVFDIPETLEPVTVIAVGYQDDPEILPPDLREREIRPRERRPLGETVFWHDLATPFDVP